MGIDNCESQDNLIKPEVIQKSLLDAVRNRHMGQVVSLLSYYEFDNAFLNVFLIQSIRGRCKEIVDMVLKRENINIHNFENTFKEAWNTGNKEICVLVEKVLTEMYDKKNN